EHARRGAPATAIARPRTAPTQPRRQRSALPCDGWRGGCPVVANRSSTFPTSLTGSGARHGNRLAHGGEGRPDPRSLAGDMNTRTPRAWSEEWTRWAAGTCRLLHLRLQGRWDRDPDSS